MPCAPTPRKTHRPTKHPKPTKPAIAFIPPPSRLISIRRPNSKPTTDPHPRPPQPNPNTDSLATLLLSFPIAQKIHALILTSRQIEGFARGWYDSQMDPFEIARRMSRLEEQYDTLREEVECELESAWVNAGFLPADLALPTFSPSNKSVAKSMQQANTNTQSLDEGGDGEVYEEGYTVDKALKKKAEEDMEAREGEKKKKVVHEEGDEQNSWGAVQPVGVMTCMVPLTGREKLRMQRWEFKGAFKGRRKSWEECASPRSVAPVVRAW